VSYVESELSLRSSRSSNISRPPSLPGGRGGIARTRNLRHRRDKRTSTVSPTLSSRPARAFTPLTLTRPASQISFARVRRRTMRLHFRKRSRRIRSKFEGLGSGRSGFLGFGASPRVLKAFLYLNKTVLAELHQELADFIRSHLIHELIPD
jgi:hypothetical protein